MINSSYCISELICQCLQRFGRACDAWLTKWTKWYSKREFKVTPDFLVTSVIACDIFPTPLVHFPVGIVMGNPRVPCTQPVPIPVGTCTHAKQVWFLVGVGRVWVDIFQPVPVPQPTRDIYPHGSRYLWQSLFSSDNLWLSSLLVLIYNTYRTLGPWLRLLPLPILLSPTQ